MRHWRVIDVFKPLSRIVVTNGMEPPESAADVNSEIERAAIVHRSGATARWLAQREL